MKDLFVTILGSSLYGAVLILAVIVVRLILRKAPRWSTCLLWALVGVRLLVPASMESPLSLQPLRLDVSELKTDILVSVADESFFVTQEAVPSWMTPDYIPQYYTDDYHTRSMVDYVAIGTIIWAVAATLILLYALVSYIRMRLKVRDAYRDKNGIYRVYGVDTAFLLGYLRPRIYIPADLPDAYIDHVTAHEKAHVARGDNWLKLAAFLCLALHWFNPLVWVAFALFCKDSEAACDEMVVRNLDVEGRKQYSLALLECGTKAKAIFGCPIAFGEVSVKQRIKEVLRYKKPVAWVTAVAVLAIFLTGAFLVPAPQKQSKYPLYYEELIGCYGKQPKDVFKALKIGSAEVTDENGLYYVIPVSVEYHNLEFDSLLLVFNPETYEFVRFDYSKTYDVKDADNVFAEFATFGESLDESFGEMKNFSGTGVQESEKILESYHREMNPDSMSASWEITDPGSAIKAKIAEYDEKGANAFFRAKFEGSFATKLDNGVETPMICATMTFKITYQPKNGNLADYFGQTTDVP